MAFKYYEQAKILQQSLDAAGSEKEFNRLQKRLNKTKKLVEKWRNKALKMDGLPNAESKLPKHTYTTLANLSVIMQSTKQSIPQVIGIAVDLGHTHD